MLARSPERNCAPPHQRRRSGSRSQRHTSPRVLLHHHGVLPTIVREQTTRQWAATGALPNPGVRPHGRAGNCPPRAGQARSRCSSRSSQRVSVRPPGSSASWSRRQAEMRAATGRTRRATIRRARSARTRLGSRRRHRRVCAVRPPAESPTRPPRRMPREGIPCRGCPPSGAVRVERPAISDGKRRSGCVRRRCHALFDRDACFDRVLELRRDGVPASALPRQPRSRSREQRGAKRGHRAAAPQREFPVGR